MSFVTQGNLSRPRIEPKPGGTSINIIQGEYKVSDDADVTLTTLLGSCVAACMRDPVAGIGGMNHFLLPGKSDKALAAGEIERHGVHAMELLVNALLTRGAQRRNLEVKLFGGAKTVNGLSDIGAQNAAFAVNFAKRERITIVSECLGGLRGRRIQFSPVSGKARRIFMAVNDDIVARSPPPASTSFGSLELF